MASTAFPAALMALLMARRFFFSLALYLQPAPILQYRKRNSYFPAAAFKKEAARENSRAALSGGGGNRTYPYFPGKTDVLNIGGTESGTVARFPAA